MVELGADQTIDWGSMRILIVDDEASLGKVPKLAAAPISRYEYSLIQP